MKIAIVAPEVFPVPPIRGGAVETNIEECSRHLTRHEVHIFSIADPALPRTESQDHRTYHRWVRSWLDRLLLCSWKLPTKDRGSIWYFWPYSRWVAHHLRELQPDVIWVHSRMPFIPWLRRAAPRARIILSIHNLNNLEGSQPWQPRYTAACDVIAGVSDFIRDAIAAQHPACTAKSRTLYNGIDSSSFAPHWMRTAERERLRQEHGLSAGPVILFVGRLVEVKGVHVLLEAFKRLLADGTSQATLLIVGSHTFSDEQVTPYIKNLRHLAESCGDRVRFVGYVSREEIGRYFLMSDIVAFPSIWQEPFGTVILEAMASGLPVVAFARGGTVEVIHHERDSWLVSNGVDEVEGFAEGLRALLTNPSLRESLGREARAMVEQRFTWPVIAKKFLQLCEEADHTDGSVDSSSRVEKMRGQSSSVAPKAPLRVLIAESGSGFGGTGKYLRELVSLLDPTRYCVTVVAAEKGPFIEQVRAEEARVLIRRAWRFPWAESLMPRTALVFAYPLYGLASLAQLLCVVPGIAWWLRRERIQLVHLNNEILSHLPLLCAARLVGCRVVCHLHGWRLFTRTERWAARYVDTFVCVTEAGARFHRDQLGGSNVLTIPNGLRLNGQLADLTVKRIDQRRQLELCNEQIAVALLGRLVPWKGHVVYLQALAQAMRLNPHIVGLVVGNDPTPSQQHLIQLKQVSASLGIASRVKFLPWQEDVWSLYAAADVVVHASVQPEPFGLVILEAMAAGRPVVATKAGGVVDLVVENVTGVLVPPSDASALASAIVRLSTDRAWANHLARAAQERAQTVFTMERNATQVAALYDRLLGQSSSVREAHDDDGN